MSKLVETKLQKAIFFVGGVLIFITLFDVGYYERWSGILEAVGIAALTFVLLAILRGYDSMRIWKFIKRHKIVLSAVLITLLLIIGLRAYMVYMESKEADAYQDCSRKVKSLSTWEARTDYSSLNGAGIDSWSELNRRALSEVRVEHNKYFDEWGNAENPYLEGGRASEVAFMKWMMENHPDFCNEYNPDLIKRHIDKK